MKITEVKTYTAGQEGRGAFLFCRVFTDAGIHGVGEAAGWPSVEAEIQLKAAAVVGEDPFAIERLWSRMFLQTHGMTGVTGAAAMSAIEMALWDIKGKALDTPVWNLLGGKMHDRLRVYTHCDDAEKARELVDQGYTGLKMGNIENCLRQVAEIRAAVGDGIDLMVDLHGMPWMTTRDAISMGRALEEYGLFFYEEPVAPENVEAMARVSEAIDIPLAAGERLAYIYGARELIEREIVDVIQPDAGRFGGLSQMKKVAGMAEAHYIQVAPHDGSLGPVGEIASLHLCAAIPNFLIWEHRTGDIPARYEVMAPQPQVVDGHMTPPDGPGLGVDLVDEAIERYPGSPGSGGYFRDSRYDYQYVHARRSRARWLRGPE